MNPAVFVVSATVLAVERVAYAVIWRQPERFAAVCRRLFAGRDPVDVLAWLFVGFKVAQGGVFLAWCLVPGGALGPFSRPPAPLLAGSALLLAGQVLNLGVFARLGRVGVFYGNRLGHDIAWCRGFPFSVVRHPQYVGTVLSIWGFFVALRYPASDWAALPLLETVYYVLGSLAEHEPGDGALTAAAVPSATAADRPAAGRPR